MQSILIEGPIGRRRNIFDKDGRLTKRCTEYKNGNWRRVFYHKGIKTTSIEFDGISVCTVVFDANGKIVAISEE